VTFSKGEQINVNELLLAYKVQCRGGGNSVEEY